MRIKSRIQKNQLLKPFFLDVYYKYHADELNENQITLCLLKLISCYYNS